jgi:hypothetical protein
MRQFFISITIFMLCASMVFATKDTRDISPFAAYAEPVSNSLAHPEVSLPGPELILAETFEESFPSGLWTLRSAGAEAYWGGVNCLSAEGNWSAWCAGGGAAAPPPCYQYTNNMNSWMIYGPFDLSDATSGNCEFLFYCQEELGYDRFFFGATGDIDFFNGYWVDSNYGDWTAGGVDFSNVPGCGSLLGKPEVWIGFQFTSDADNTRYGIYLDNITIYKTVSDSPTPTPIPDQPGVSITIPSDFVHPGDSFYIDGYVNLPDQPIANVNLAFVLDVCGSYYFWPSWVKYPSTDWRFYSSIPAGNTYVRVLPTFIWPDTGSSSASNLQIYGMLLDDAATHVIGNYAIVNWGYGP